MKLNKILTPLFVAATISTVAVPLSSCSCSQETQKTFSFGNNKLYVPKKEALAKQKNKSNADIVKMWANAIKEDPNIFYDDVHYAIDREWYVEDSQKEIYTILPQGTLNFRWFEIDTTSYTISFELEYTFHLQYNKDKPILGHDWNKYEFEGRIDFYNVPLIKGDILLGSELGGYEKEEIPYYAVMLTDTALKDIPWYIHGIELGYVYDNNGTQYESAHNGWVSGFSQDSYNPREYPLGYFISYAPFIWAKGNPGSLEPHINIGNYYLKNNIPEE